MVEMPPTTAERAHEQAMARQALDSLAEKDRLALLMREEGLNYEEIAAALELSVGSVGTTLARARRRLAETYESLQAGEERRPLVEESDMTERTSTSTKERFTPGSMARCRLTSRRASRRTRLRAPNARHWWPKRAG